MVAVEVAAVTEISDDRLAQYREQGYTIFEGVYDETRMQPWRDEIVRLEAASVGMHAQSQSWWFGNMLERSPALMWPTVSNPLILDFAERACQQGPTSDRWR